MKTHLFAVLALGLLAGACTENGLKESGSEIQKGQSRLNISVNPFEMYPIGTRASVGQVCSRISFGLFGTNGEKVMTTQSQVAGDQGFGTLSVTLNPGEYILVTIAHNGDSNCTITSPTAVTFNNKERKITDTFTSCDTITVAEGNQNVSITLKRRVAMMRIVLHEKINNKVKNIKFYYTGGSANMNPATGFGTTDSKVTEVISVPESAYTTEDCTFDLLTIPHAESDTLKLTITALDATDGAVIEREISQVPVKVGQISEFKGVLIGSISDISLGITADVQEWTKEDFNF